MANDRRTAIFGDQIVDHTITKDELEPVVDPKHWQMLTWDNTSSKLSWSYNIEPIIFD